MTNIPIRGLVARILSSRDLVINVGSRDGVNVGMYFDVLDPKGEDIKDPETGESLGSLERPKVRLKITKVQERLSIASTYRKSQVNVGGSGPDLGAGVDLSRLFIPPKIVTRYETLKTNEQTRQNLDEKDSYVKVGDPVVQVIPEVDIEATEHTT